MKKKTSNKTIVEFEGVSKVYNSSAGNFKALDNIRLDIKEGAFVSVIGRSGSGKSTFLNLLTGIDKQTNGDIIVNGTPIKTIKEKNMSVWRGKNVGIIFQFFQLIPTLTALENIILPMDLVGEVPKKIRKDKAKKLLEKVGLSRHGGKFPSELSGGEQQRVAIARALANDSPILIADEPTGNLDLENATMILDLFRSLNKEGITIIMVTHEREDIKAVTHVIELSDGHIVENYAPQQEVS